MQRGVVAWLRCGSRVARRSCGVENGKVNLIDVVNMDMVNT